MDSVFREAHIHTGRPSVPPEWSLKALLLMALDSLRSERQLCERIITDLLFRWFLDRSPEAPVLNATVFTPNKPRLDQFGITGAVTESSFLVDVQRFALPVSFIIFRVYARTHEHDAILNVALNAVLGSVTDAKTNM